MEKPRISNSECSPSIYPEAKIIEEEPEARRLRLLAEGFILDEKDHVIGAKWSECAPNQ